MGSSMDPLPPQNHFTYIVSRPIYSNPTFEEDNQRQAREERTLRERLGLTCGCSGKRALKVVKGVFPVIDWLSRYPIREWLPSDVISGVSTGLVCSLQGLAYALLVSVSPVYGLYSAFFPILTYFLLGTSRHISVGPFPVTCLMVGSVVLTLAPDDHFLISVNGTGDSIGSCSVSALSLSLPVQVVMGFLQVGFLVRYLSDPLVGGFTTAAAFHVLISQLRIVLSVPTDNHNGCFSVTLIDVFTNISQTNLADLVAGLLTIVIVVAVKELNAKFQHRIPVPIPIELIVTVVAAGISYATELESHYGASIVQSIPRGFAPAQPPNTDVLWNILGSSFSTAVVGYAVAVSVAKVYAAKHDYPIDGNQELIAFGFSNMFCGCFSSFVASTALSRTAVQESTGGKSQVAGMVSAMVVMIVILALGHLLEPLQKSVLAAIVIANLKGMFMQVTEVPTLWRQNRADCFIWLATCLASMVLGLDMGLLSGLVFEMGTVVFRTQFPACSTLGNIPGTNIYRNMKDYQNIAEVPGVKIFKCNSPIYFANIDYFKERLRATVSVFIKLYFTMTCCIVAVVVSPYYSTSKQSESLDDGNWPVSEVEVHVDWALELPVRVSVPKVPIHSLVLDFSAVSFVDVVAVKSLHLVRVTTDVIDAVTLPCLRSVKSLAFFDVEITQGLLFLSVHDAILFIKLETANGGRHDAIVEKVRRWTFIMYFSLHASRQRECCLCLCQGLSEGQKHKHRRPFITG
uniref:STAS domain-containing protein n=1 Tax=Esox lucius TaxID=8010 RepID=A0A6Q2Z3E6_ESOLU